MDTVARGWLRVRSGGGGRLLVFIEIHSWRTGVEIEGSILLIWNFQETGTLLVSSAQIRCWGDNWRCSVCVSWDAAAWLTALATAEMATCSDLTVVTSLWFERHGWVTGWGQSLFVCQSVCVYIFVASDLRVTLFLNEFRKIHAYFCIFETFLIYYLYLLNDPQKTWSSGETGTLTGVCL